jgi:ABC-type ATPase with predicted acetyltransferase domain
VTTNWKCQHCGTIVSSHDTKRCCSGPAEYTHVELKALLAAAKREVVEAVRGSLPPTERGA